MLKEGVILEFKDFIDDIFEEESIIYDVVPKTRKIVYCDTSKGYEDIEIIIKRKSDNKYFKCVYSESEGLEIDADGLCNFPMQCTQVFPKQKTITVYE